MEALVGLARAVRLPLADGHDEGKISKRPVRTSGGQASGQNLTTLQSNMTRRRTGRICTKPIVRPEGDWRRRSAGPTVRSNRRISKPHSGSKYLVY